MRKHFEFITFRNNWKIFIVFIIINIIGQYRKGWSIDDMIESNIIITTVWIFGGLVIDWIMIIRENYNSKNKNLK